MSFTRLCTMPAVLLGLAVPASAQSVSVSFNNGLVSVSAQNAPVRQILAEWARLGGTTFVNAERVPGGPVTLQLENVSEREALDVLLRDVSGYMVAAARQDSGTGASLLDRILIVPTSSAPRPSTPAFQPPPVPQPRPVPQFEPEFQPEPEPEPAFEPDPAEENPPNDIPPEEAGERPFNPRVRVPFAPPNGNGRPMPPQPFQPDPDDVQEDGDRDVEPDNPFGVPRGSSRPGEITPVPERNERNDEPQPDPEP